MPQTPQTAGCAYPRTRFWRAVAILGRATTCRQLRRGDFEEILACGVPQPGPTLSRAGFALWGELPVQPLEHGVGTVVGTQPQDPAPGVFDHAPSLEHEFLHHRLHAPPLGRMAHWRVFANQRILANQAQDVHRHRSQRAYQEVGVKLAAGQTLQVHVGFELGVKLLVRGMVLVHPSSTPNDASC